MSAETDPSLPSPSPGEQAFAVLSGRTPGPERVDVDLWSYPAGSNEVDHGHTLATVVFAGEGVTIFDPGPDEPGGVDELDRFLRGQGRGVADIVRIVLTHSHEDHVGLAAAIHRASGAEILLHGADIDALRILSDNPTAMTHPHGPAHRLPAATTLRDGAALQTGRYRWTVRATPGHTPGHVCIVDVNNGRILTGDHVLPHLFPGIGLSVASQTDPVADYLESLEKLEPYDDFEVLPGHGYRFRGLGARRRVIRDRVLQRASEVARVIRAHPLATDAEIAAQLTWSVGWEQLAESRWRASALRQTSLYRRFVESGAPRL